MFVHFLKELLKLSEIRFPFAVLIFYPAGFVPLTCQVDLSLVTVSNNLPGTDIKVNGL